jgi:nucleoside-diphosphate-sugar epimerase
MKILLTGASGFIGSSIERALNKNKYYEVAVTIRSPKTRHISKKIHIIGNINSETEWLNALLNQNIVIHTAGLSFNQRNFNVSSMTDYKSVNIDGTIKLATQAALMGVKRFIFISTIKVNGEATSEGLPFTIFDNPIPEDEYSKSKYIAEEMLFELGKKTGMEIVVIRPPLVYGYGVKGNFSQLIKLIKYGVPLPLDGINNKRSFVGLNNLVDLIIRCLDNPAVANKVILASDNMDMSTTELVCALGNAMGCQVRLFKIPANLLLWSAKLVGKDDTIHRLFNSLQVDISDTIKILNWVPPYTVDECIKNCFTSK